MKQQNEATLHDGTVRERSYSAGVRVLERLRFSFDECLAKSPDDVHAWLVHDALRGASANALVAGFACRLQQAGLGVERMSVNVGTLHPQLFGYSWVWSRDDAICDEVQIGEAALTSDAYIKNPLFRVCEYGESFHLSLTDPANLASSSLMQELALSGFTDYIAEPLSSWDQGYNGITLATKQPGGFDKAQYESLSRLIKIFALHAELHISRRIANNVSTTYLGHQAGSRVIQGSIKRGSGLSISAIVWSSDMRGFSTLSENLGNLAIVDMLNQYFSVLAEAVMDHGGDVLKFIGDGMLAVFPLEDFDTPQLAAKAAADAAKNAVKGLEQLGNGQKNTQKLRTGIGLHLGDVFFGNIGASRRLDFTVIGEAVNIASRIEGLCKSEQRTVLMSAPVAELLKSGTEPLGSHKLKGMEKPEQLYALLV